MLTSFADASTNPSSCQDGARRKVTIEAWDAARTVIALLPNLKALRPQLAELPAFDLARFDKLGQYALAFIHAHALHRATGTTKSPLAALAAELVPIRDQLLLSAKVLVAHGLLHPSQLRGLKKTKGYLALADNVLVLVCLFRQNWPTIENKTPVTPAELLDAGKRADVLLRLYAERKHGASRIGDAAKTRDKAFTLLIRAYDDARRAVEYLRRNEGDARSIAPSLYKGRGKRKAKVMAS
jgi:hypothetical protein